MGATYQAKCNACGNARVEAVSAVADRHVGASAKQTQRRLHGRVASTNHQHACPEVSVRIGRVITHVWQILAGDSQTPRPGHPTRR